MVKKIDLLQFVQRGGCASKIPAKNLADLLSDLNFGTHPNLLVGNETNDDASVWKINDDVAIIQTTDFFPPLCSDPYEFGQIAVANALSDVYAMGGTPITALNLVMFPATTVDLVYLKEILKGGADKAADGGVILTGGHSIGLICTNSTTVFRHCEFVGGQGGDGTDGGSGAAGAAGAPGGPGGNACPGEVGRGGRGGDGGHGWFGPWGGVLVWFLRPEPYGSLGS